ncbi:MAG: taurine ABC transporter substrate-binding protein [Deltaproteobacteria bacterium]|nr:taurine ABC transporter substrate-binding protein [Deltaproteobacteria bacterium]
MYTPRLLLTALLATLALGLVACSGTDSGGDASKGETPAKTLKPVTVGYQGMINPWKATIGTGAFAEATGREIEWRRFSSGSEVITAMASGDVQLAVAGSSPIATALSQGLDLKLIWIVEAIDTAEALVSRKALGLTSVDGLVGKTVGVPFASTTHYHLLYALERAGVEPSSLKVLNLQPDAIAASWQQEQIDAAFVWSPVLDTLRADGDVLVTSGELAAAGRPTFDGLVADSRFADQNAEFVGAFIKTLAAADEDWRATGAQWTATSPQVVAIAERTGAPADSVLGVLKQYSFPTAAEQASAKWLGGGAESAAAAALADTSRFLVEQRKVPRALDDYTQFLAPQYANAAK